MLKYFLLFFMLFFILGFPLTWANGSCNVPSCIPAPLPLPVHIVPANEISSHRPTMSATLYPGSVKSNVKRIANEYGWPQVVWKLDYDYNWVGQTTLHASSLNGLLSQLLKGYPLQAVFYHGNHVLAIYPRVLK